MAIDTATRLDLIEMFAGDRVLLRFDIVDVDADEDDPPPLDLFGSVARWSMSRITDAAGTWSEEADVDLNSSDDGDQVVVDCKQVATVGISVAGSGYQAGDVLAVVGGVGMPARVEVLTVNGGGGVTSAAVKFPGRYAATPGAAAAAVVGGNQTCSLSLTYSTRRGSVLVMTTRSDTEGLSGSYHQELEVVDSSGEGKVLAVGDVVVQRNVRNK